MAKHVCPKCAQVTLTLGKDACDILCPFCNEVFGLVEDKELGLDNKNISY